MHGQLGVWIRRAWIVVKARAMTEQDWDRLRLVIGMLDQHSHIATDALQAPPATVNPRSIIRCTRRRLMLHPPPAKKVNHEMAPERFS